MHAAQPVLKIFLSSTAIDMQEYRKEVSDTIVSLESLPVRMESFSAVPDSPVKVCIEKVKQSKALIVMVAHRYGWVPSVEEGGDGKKSITWLEVETALQNNIPVFVFIVDEKYGWTQAKEQDLIIGEPDKKRIDDIIRNIQSLQEFKKFLNTKANITRDVFTTPDNLAKKVTASLAKWEPYRTPLPEKTDGKEIPLSFRTVHHLQPAPHFKGRKALLNDLLQWWQQTVTTDRIVALIAIGGTGKTALTERFIKNIAHEPLRGSVLVWSFYDSPNTDAFLHEACALFTGEEPEGAGGKLEKLQRTLQADDRQHLIILDGLERVQSEGRQITRHAKGDLEDHQLKNLLRSVAAGLGNTRILITSRFKLTDLAEWEDLGYKTYELDVLDTETAVEVLKAWQVQGTDKELENISVKVGCHALSVSVLGSYLHHYCNGNAHEITSFNLEDISPNEPQAAKLLRILGGYAKDLPEEERDLLTRLSVFPNGITVDILRYLINAGGAIAGTLTGAGQKKITIIADRLKQQGLIYSYDNNQTTSYTAHPFLRGYFSTLLGVQPEHIHEVIRENLALGLDTKPQNKPTDIIVLNKYEQLIEHSILAGHYQKAFDLFWSVMGGDIGNFHIYHSLGDYGRMVRILSSFAKDGVPDNITSQILSNDKFMLSSYWGLAAMSLGDLKTAHNCFTYSETIVRKSGKQHDIARSLQNIAVININKGLYPKAKDLLEESEKCIEKESKAADNTKYISYINNAHTAYVLHQMGEPMRAKEKFLQATKICGKALYSITGFYEADHFFKTELKDKALQRTNENLIVCTKYHAPQDITLCHYLLGMLSLPESVIKAKTYLQKIRDWTKKSGEMHCIIRSHILAAEIAYCSGNYDMALAETKTGLNHAEGCGFGTLAIDLLVLLSKAYISLSDHKQAIEHARQATSRSVNPYRQYAWGEANGLHLAGVCYYTLGGYHLARQQLKAALKLREKIQHPETGETRKLLESLP